MNETTRAARQTLSVAIITRDEADRIGRCLDSVKDLADEIIVLDSGSTDGTLDIVARYTDKYYSTDWPGYGVQKQRALAKTQFDWFLSIDADEALDSQMQEWLGEFLTQENSGIAGAKLPWGVTVYGKRLDYGRSARAPLRLARREGARFSEARVHEELCPGPGKIVTARGRLLHFTHRHFGHALEKNLRYSWLSSQQYFDEGRRCHSLFSAVLHAVWVFILVYIIRRGFLDGPVGFLIATNFAQISFNKYAGLWTLTRAEKQAAKRDA